MKTLTIEDRSMDTSIKIKGLSLKAVKHCFSLSDVLFRGDSGEGYIMFQSTGNKVGIERMIKCLAELYKTIPFDKIKIVGTYELTGEELFEKIKAKISHDAAEVERLNALYREN